jgi:hypothetical protein
MARATARAPGLETKIVWWLVPGTSTTVVSATRAVMASRVLSGTTMSPVPVRPPGARNNSSGTVTAPRRPETAAESRTSRQSGATQSSTMRQRSRGGVPVRS